MNISNFVDELLIGPAEVEAQRVLVRSESAARVLQDLLAHPTEPRAASPAGIEVGELVALDEGGAAFVFIPARGTAALRARSVIDLHGAHIGRQVVVSFERDDATKPIVMGVLRGEGPNPEVPEALGSLEIDADGERLWLRARDQLVLRCGRASITLTRSGKVVIDGTYVLSRSSGANRIKGGSVQLN